MTKFGEILELADNLPFEEILMLIEILKKRISEAAGRRIVDDVKNANDETDTKNFTISSVEDIIDEIIK